MKDRLGKEIKVGDSILYIDKNYKALNRGIIDKINAKKVTIKSRYEIYGKTIRDPKTIIVI